MAAIGRPIVTLAAEVVGYSMLIRADEKGALEQLKAHRDQFVDPKIAEHSGRILRATGNSLVVGFESPAEAVRCAVELQSGMIDRNIQTLPDRRITLRIGVAIDQVTGNGDDLVSRAVAALPRDTLATLIKPGAGVYGEPGNLAVRLATLAEPAGICISGAVRDAIRDQLPYKFKDLGEQNLEIRAAPLHCYAMNADMVASGPRLAAQNQRRRLMSLRNAAVAVGVLLVLAAAIAPVVSPESIGKMIRGIHERKPVGVLIGVPESSPQAVVQVPQNAPTTAPPVVAAQPVNPPALPETPAPANAATTPTPFHVAPADVQQAQIASAQRQPAAPTDSTENSAAATLDASVSADTDANSSAPANAEPPPSTASQSSSQTKEKSVASKSRRARAGQSSAAYSAGGRTGSVRSRVVGITSDGRLILRLPSGRTAIVAPDEDGFAPRRRSRVFIDRDQMFGLPPGLGPDYSPYD